MAMAESGDRLPHPPARPFPLYKHLSWSPDADRDHAWDRRKKQSKNRRSRSLTDDDLTELKACIDLGFGFDSPELDRRLYDTFPALRFYCAVNKQYNDRQSDSTASSSSSESSPTAIITHGESPQMVKARLKQWAQVVACSVRRR